MKKAPSNADLVQRLYAAIIADTTGVLRHLLIAVLKVYEVKT